jgi:hypothetical protein
LRFVAADCFPGVQKYLGSQVFSFGGSRDPVSDVTENPPGIPLIEETERLNISLASGLDQFPFFAYLEIYIKFGRILRVTILHQVVTSVFLLVQ